MVEYQPAIAASLKIMTMSRTLAGHPANPLYNRIYKMRSFHISVLFILVTSVLVSQTAYVPEAEA